MSVYTGKIILKDRGGFEVFDITKKVKSEVQKSGLKNGTVTVFVPGATGALTTIEYESGLVQDLEDFFNKNIPQGKDYHHEKKWHDGNGHSHLRASLIGPSISVPFIDSQLTLGTWQQIIFLELDNKPHYRELVVQIIGE